MSTTLLRNPLHLSDGWRLNTLRRTLRTGAMLTALAAVALAAARLLDEDRTIRGELRAAAAEFRSEIIASPTERVRQAMRRHFREEAVEVDAARFPPNVLVTLRGIDRATCETAVRDTRDMEARVVVRLYGYGSPADCNERNDMTWWIMP